MVRRTIFLTPQTSPKTLFSGLRGVQTESVMPDPALVRRPVLGTEK
jgi:hypothetical protein